MLKKPAQHLIHFACLFLLILTLNACSLGRPFTKPEVHVVNLTLTSATLLETSAIFDVRVDNENPYPIKIEGGVHRLYLNDIYVGKGFDNKGFEVPRLSSTTVPITVNISNLSLMTKLQSLFSSPKLSYRVESTLHREDSFSSVNTSDSGEFDFSGSAGNDRKYRKLG